MPKHIVNAGTDIACVGIWDAALPRAHHSISANELAASATRGEVLPIRTGADGSFVLWIHMDEAFVTPPGQMFETIDREFGLNLSSGTAIGGGCEDFRNPSPQITSEKDRFAVEPSWYRTRVHLNRTDSEELEHLAYVEAQKVLTPEERARYHQLGRRARMGCALIVASAMIGIAALLIRGVVGIVGGALVVALLGAEIANRLWLKRTDYESMHLRLESALEAALPPYAVLELHRCDASLPGGTVEAEQVTRD